MSVIEDVVEQVADWKGKQISIQSLSGGLTNTNYRVNVEDASFFVRVPGVSTELLAVNRENEHFNTKAASEVGAGPKVFYYVPEHQAMVLEFLEGRTMSKDTLNVSRMPTRIAKSIRRLHSAPRFFSDFNMFRLTEYYLKICGERNFRIPDGYVKRMPLVMRIESAMHLHPLPTVPCNNDLLAENYIDDGIDLRIIDYEYSGNNDPTFELGNTCQELQYSDDQIEEVCSAYFGQASMDKIARMKLNMIMSDVGWGLWAAIQANISKIEFDFWSWAVERWERAVAKMDSKDFGGWLKDVQSL